MKKIILLSIVLLAIAFVGYIVISKSGKELNEVSPLEVSLPSTESPPPIKDNLDAMSEEKKQEFMAEVEAMKDVVMEKNETMPPKTQIVARGDFMRRIHSVKGSALLIGGVGQKIVRFENFETDNGPQLHIYLSADLGASDFVDLGPIKATKGNVNYPVPAGTNTQKYRYILVWCKPFGVLFSYAELK